MLKYVKILDRCKIVHILAPDNNKNTFIMTTQTTNTNKVKEIKTMIKDIESIRKTMRLSHPETVYNHLGNAWAKLYREACEILGSIKIDITETEHDQLKQEITDAINTSIKY